MPLTRTRDTQPNDSALATVRVLTTSDDPRYPAEGETTPPIPNPLSGGNPARSPVEDAAADAVPIYLPRSTMRMHPRNGDSSTFSCGATTLKNAS